MPSTLPDAAVPAEVRLSPQSIDGCCGGHAVLTTRPENDAPSVAVTSCAATAVMNPSASTVSPWSVSRSWTVYRPGAVYVCATVTANELPAAATVPLAELVLSPHRTWA